MWRELSKLFSCVAAAAAAAAAKSLQSCPTLCNLRDDSPPGSPIPGILQARTRVGCHFLLQCMKVKSENEVTQSCLTPSDPTDCSLPGSSIHGIFQARVLEWGAIAFSENRAGTHLFCVLLKESLLTIWVSKEKSIEWREVSVLFSRLQSIWCGFLVTSWV